MLSLRVLVVLLSFGTHGAQVVNNAAVSMSRPGVSATRTASAVYLKDEY